MESKKFLSADEVAAEFGLDAASLKKFIESGEVRALADRGTWKYRRDELEGLVAAGRIEPPSADFELDEGPLADDDVEYIELDEDALAEQASRDNPVPSDADAEQDWFVPTGALDKAEPIHEQSSGEVATYSGPAVEPIREQSSSNITIYDGPGLEVEPIHEQSSSDVAIYGGPAVEPIREQSSSDVAIYDGPGLEVEPIREQSSSDVAIYGGPGLAETPAVAEPSSLGTGSDSDVVIRPGTKTAERLGEDAGSLGGEVSDSDVQLASDYQTPTPEGSGIMLDFNMDAGATVSSSGSSLRLPQTADHTDAEIERVEVDHAEVTEPDVTIMMGGDSSVWDDSGASAIGESGLDLDASAGSSVRPGEDSDSDVKLVDVTSSGVRLRAEESGILLDDGSHIGMPGGSSVLGGSASVVAEEDSGISLDFLQEDSGITLESSRSSSVKKPDSGISLDDGEDSGITLSAGDSGIALGGDESGISLSAGDSGISLSSGDSGLSLDGGDDSGISMAGDSKTLADDYLFGDQLDGGHTVELRGGMDDSSFDMNSSDATTELVMDDDEEDVDESTATVVKKGRGSSRPGLSGAFALDEPAEVEDLEISEELDATLDEEFVEEEEAVLDASDDTFGTHEAEAVEEDEDYLEPAATVRKSTGPREPAWGGAMVAGLVVCSLLLTVNVLVLWSGVSTMWSGSEPLAAAAPLIDSLGGLIGR